MSKGVETEGGGDGCWTPTRTLSPLRLQGRNRGGSEAPNGVVQVVAHEVPGAHGALHSDTPVLTPDEVGLRPGVGFGGGTYTVAGHSGWSRT